eukprot:6579715-Pyramimonas_sp.AAC.2
MAPLRLVPGRVYTRWLPCNWSPGGYIPDGSPAIGPRAGIYPLTPLRLVPGRVYTRWLPCDWSLGGYTPAFLFRSIRLVNDTESSNSTD